jgi:hypothetical protein
VKAPQIAPIAPPTALAIVFANVESVYPSMKQIAISSQTLVAYPIYGSERMLATVPGLSALYTKRSANPGSTFVNR